MLKFPRLFSENAFGLALLCIGLALAQPAQAADVDQGKKVFNKCKACHAVGEGAKNRVGPQLNEVFGRKAGGLEGYKYSKAMTEAGDQGLIWNDGTLADFLAAPKAMVKGTKMAFAGLKKEDQIADLLAWLKQEAGGDVSETPVVEEKPEETEEPANEAVKPEKPAEKVAIDATPHGVFNLGRRATEHEVAAWDIDIRPDGAGLPEGRGTVGRGEELFGEQCAACHGVFGEGAGRWPVLAGGQGTLKDERPVKTIGSYWPYLSTVYDYVRRTMPFGNARSLSDDDVYAITAYLLYLNDIVTDDEFELSKSNFNDMEMPNAGNFKSDDRLSEPNYAKKTEVCMSDCKAEPATVKMRAAVLDVTPDAENGDDVGAGAVD